MDAVEGGVAAPRSPDLVLARLHLRLGSLALARAELETLAGRDALDEDGLVDLAEARWRTGDIAGAGEAAAAALDDEDGPLLALIVAAEAAAARGRPTEARRLADRAMELAGGSIDALFAGMPRAGVWPPDAAAPPPSPTTMFDPPRRVTSAVHRHPRPQDAPTEPTGEEPEDGTEAAPPTRPSADADAATIGLWETAAAEEPDVAFDSPTDVEEPEVAPDVAMDVEAPEVAALVAPQVTAVPEAAHESALAEAAHEAESAADRPAFGTDATADLPTGERELDLGRAALDTNDPAEAAVRLGLVLRVAPALAPAVLELVEGRTESGLALVRGDAYRLVGREIDARQAFMDAARGPTWLPPAPETVDDPPGDHPPTEGEPA